jgi:hypothetical protein
MPAATSSRIAPDQRLSRAAVPHAQAAAFLSASCATKGRSAAASRSPRMSSQFGCWGRPQQRIHLRKRPVGWPARPRAGNIVYAGIEPELASGPVVLDLIIRAIPISRLCRSSLVPLVFICRPTHLRVMTGPLGIHHLLADRQLSDTQRSIADQGAYIRRMIVQGAPTQAAEDRLRELERKLAHLRKAQHRSTAGG